MLIFKHFIYKYFVISNHGGGEFMNSKDYQSPEIFLKLQQFKQLKVITYHRAILITEMFLSFAFHTMKARLNNFGLIHFFFTL